MRSGAYREVANAWSPENFTSTSEWHDAITAIADEWRASCDIDAATMPARAKDWWMTVLAHAAMPLAAADSRLDAALRTAKRLDDVDLIAAIAYRLVPRDGIGLAQVPLQGSTLREERAET